LYYKVVDLELRSAFMCGHNLLQYKINETVFPLFGKLFVFDNLFSAECFANVRNAAPRCRMYEIYECEVTNPQPPPEVVLLTRYEIARGFWDAIKHGKYTLQVEGNKRRSMFVADRIETFMCIVPPENTVCVDSVKLTTYVPYEVRLA